jgi:hypothetical protein
MDLTLTYNTDVFSPEWAKRYMNRAVETLRDLSERRSLSEILGRGKVT